MPNCLTIKEIQDQNGVVKHKSDGTVSVFYSNNNKLVPVTLSKECCLKLSPNYTFDENIQKCMWGEKIDCETNNEYKLVLSPKNKDGALFTNNNDETCELDIEFDYLIKFDCQSLLSILRFSAISTATTYTTQVLSTLSAITEQTILCNTLENQIKLLETQLNTTPYSIACDTGFVQPSSTSNISDSSVVQFGNTGFNLPSSSVPVSTETNQTTAPKFVNIIQAPQPLAGDTFCLTDVGLEVWKNILGPINYANFLNGDSKSFTCNDVTNIFNQNKTASTPLLYECNIPFGFKSNLINQINTLTSQQNLCNDVLTTLENELAALLASEESKNACDRPISVFETLSLNLNLEVVNNDGTLSTVYTTNDVFPAIGISKLYDYLTSVENSGFYVCQGTPDCTPTLIGADNIIQCETVLNSLLDDLFIESGLDNTQENITNFKSSIKSDSFASKWLSYSLKLTDQDIISSIVDKKVKISIGLNHTCGDICILLDNIKINKNCTKVTKTNIFVTKCPGFELDRIRDNKKSWINTTSLVNRDFKILNPSNENPIRQTNYNVEDERLILNSKEIDLDIDLATAIETDVWCYISDNPCILSGFTDCNPCLSACSGDNKIDFTTLTTQPLSAVTIVEDFEYYLLSELIDAKNRQTISGYPTLRALYDRYLNSSAYCATNSSAFDYTKMDTFSKLIGTYWVDIIEQVMPATTIWGSVKIYSNTIFDQQKFTYKPYTMLFCGNEFSGDTVSNPINGVSGQCSNVDVDIETITTGSTLFNSKTIDTCNVVCISQMNFGSEFIGGVGCSGENCVGYTNKILSLNSI